ncbi:unnamed protein product [Brassicogethes aeneus]|uniref:Uncharacterized protein n=1 Tax=Brassicogethes aeneus TaxID=1431903 RepID=A0A9P0FF31_BRAAE|nr:unnamed protein product [Brassicogethes aeneus]
MMELDSLDNSFDYMEENFYETPPTKNPQKRKVTFNTQIYQKDDLIMNLKQELLDDSDDDPTPSFNNIQKVPSISDLSDPEASLENSTYLD